MFNKLLSFTGGIYPPENKHLTENKAIELCDVPEIVTIPLKQHIGAPCDALVKKGDKVRLGQKIGQPRGFVSAPVHSSVSGEVKSIEIVDLPNGSKAPAVIIVNDGQDTPDESIKPDNAERLSADALKSIVTEAGIVGMGGAAFPTHVKLSPPDDRKIDILLLNGAECEPFLTSDYRLMIEHPDDILYGLKVIRKILGGVSRIYIGIEDNKPQAIKQMTAAAKNENDIQVVTLRTKYPQGAEKQLIYAITGRQVPSGGLPMDVGAVVQNVGTAAAIAFAVRDGLPLYRKLVTVSGGAVREQKNLMVRIGTSFREVIDFCGGWTEEPAKVINGGPMMGVAQYTLDVPVTKETSGILLFTKEEAAVREVSNCIRCGRCISVCPIHLMPLTISARSLAGNYEEADKLHAMDCVECGSCSYICPASRPLLHSIQMAKKEIMEERKRRAQAK
ncbi:MAG: electron transport complex subunit RsxC [Caldicoprobacterales bacterium]|nr:electron transport complex subunit RsxC [Clostridiales bacterium]